uniref:Ig-like domain-containing protein n=2 Tax=Xenopus tropicalis TaxID=8364 RepID=A0A1B8Y2P4_XENTR
MGEIIKPDTLIHGKEGRFQCKIWGYFPLCLELRWFRIEVGVRERIPLFTSEKYFLTMEPERQSDGTFCGTALLIVSVDSATEQGVQFICQVRHPSLGEPLERSTGALSVTVNSAEPRPLP